MKTMSFVLVLLFLTATQALAAPVFVESGLDEREAMARAEKMVDGVELSLGGALAEALGVSEKDLVVMGAPVTRCHSSNADSIEKQLFGVRTLVDDMDYGRARAAIETIADGLPCLAETVETEALFDLYLLGGIAAFYDDQMDRAADFFARAAALDPARPWPNEYPPAPKAVYLESFKDALASPPANFRSEFEGTVRLDGRVWTGEPRLYVGSHIVWVEELGLGVGIEVPARTELPNGEIVLTSGARLEAGLLAGAMTYEPLLHDLAEASSWDSAVLVSADGVLEYRSRTFVLPPKMEAELSRAAKRAAGPSPLTIGGLGMAVAGGGLAGAGLGLYFQTTSAGRVRVGEPLKTPEQYQTLDTRSDAGLAIVIAGGATAITGVTLAIIGAAQRAKQREQAVVVAPWFIGSRDGAAVGISGRLP
ncbi:MAG: hypothetical protein KDA24_26215 [Deltaproteobacteria bacterium]|nr:hypothetical protein [Deltaproteobacteria bacterium]